MQVQSRELVKRDNKKHQKYVTMQLQTQTKRSSQMPSAKKTVNLEQLGGGEIFSNYGQNFPKQNLP